MTQKKALSTVHIFEVHYSGDGIENQRAFCEGTWVDVIFYQAELIAKGYVNISIIKKEN